MDIKNKKIGVIMTGSFCTFSKVIEQIKELVKRGADVLPIMSYNSYELDTKFGEAEEIIKKVEDITGKKIIHTIQGAEPIGPKQLTDMMPPVWPSIQSPHIRQASRKTPARSICPRNSVSFAGKTGTAVLAATVCVPSPQARQTMASAPLSRRGLRSRLTSSIWQHSSGKTVPTVSIPCSCSSWRICSSSFSPPV